MLNFSTIVYCFHVCTIGPLKFDNKHAIVHNWFAEPARERGIGVSNRWYSFILLLTLSIWILSFAICSVSFISFTVNFFLLLKNAGIVSLTCFSANTLVRVNPLSAMTSSPGSKRSRIPDNLVISTLDMQPVNSGDMKVTRPWGEMPKRHLNVQVPLYVEYIWEFKTRDDGCWVLISVQSISTRVLGYATLKHSGINSSIVSLFNHIGILPSTKYRKFAHVIIFRLTVGREVLNRTAKSCSIWPALSLHRNMNNSSIRSIFLFRPARLRVSLAT